MTSGNYGPPEGSNQPYGQQPPAQGAPGQYGQPQYEQGQYGGYGAPPPAYSGPAEVWRFGVVGAVLTVLGAIACVIAFTATNWYGGRSVGGNAHFSDVHDVVKALDSANVANGVAVVYFAWLAWVLLAVAALAALAANLPTAASRPFRAIGALIALAGIVLTLLSIKLISSSSFAQQNHIPSSYGDYLKHALKAPSIYLTVGGFLLICIGSLIGSRRVLRSADYRG